ncbi:hypothetical protein EYF80_066105 [Liparis tanakae]|uniref:Uncharacterized protein n=1 Tax=Liparis tanakae TaxID=230148 RepID=A0A4Z2E546_9TELE|nr:hypothetical protein EYF80_066105 [Liparis tanakae]
MFPQAELEEREERKRMQELREQENRHEDEKERQLEQRQVGPADSSLCVCVREEVLTLCLQEEDERRAKEEQDRRDEEEYLKLKASFIIEDQGEEEQLTEDQVCVCHGLNVCVCVMV